MQCSGASPTLDGARAVDADMIDRAYATLKVAQANRAAAQQRLQCARAEFDAAHAFTDAPELAEAAIQRAAKALNLVLNLVENSETALLHAQKALSKAALCGLPPPAPASPAGAGGAAGEKFAAPAVVD